MENNEENVQYKNLGNEVKGLEEKYDVKINYHKKNSIKNKIKTMVISGLVVASFVSGGIVSEKFVDYVHEQQQESNMLKYDANTKKFYYNESNQFDKFGLWFLFDFENGNVTLCQDKLEEDLYSISGYSYNYYDVKTGVKVGSAKTVESNRKFDGIFPYFDLNNKELVNYNWLVSNFDYDVKTGIVKKFDFKNERYSNFENVNQIENGKSK